ncbi:MAG TPA: hypothetical protein VK185_00455, partial [Candidatus Bathyarchaeia archaeon]|nr:hypothetical protein [Candidatus Bathyarchaeia archaeon]
MRQAAQDDGEPGVAGPQAIGSWAAAARGANVALSLVLPPLSRDGLAKAEGVVRALEGAEDSEVVAGDWGTVHRLRSRHPGLTIVLGRLTHKMLRDPRLADRFDSPLALHWTPCIITNSKNVAVRI